MRSAPETIDDDARHARLRQLAVLDTCCDPAASRLARIAAAAFDAPAALMAVVSDTAVLCTGRVGLEPQDLAVAWSLCAPAMLGGTTPGRLHAEAVGDWLAEDPGPGASGGRRVCIATPLLLADGQAIGALGVIDTVPRAAPDARQVAALQDLAALAVQDMHRQPLPEHRANPPAADAQQVADRGLLAAYKAKSDFLASLSHELRTPLNAIIGFAELIAERPGPDPATASHAAEIREAGRHMLVLVNDVLEYSRLEAGGLRLSWARVELQRPLDEALRMVAAYARGRGVAIRKELVWPDAIVRGDSVRLKQVLLNLLTNAIRFTPRGGSVCARLTRGHCGAVQLEVEDTGIGIAAGDIGRALTAYGQIFGDGGATHEGTGLGLPIAKALVEKHGGQLLIESTVGVGTRVTVRLAPLAGSAS